MLVKRFLGLTTALVVFTACGETPTTPEPLDSELLTVAADPGNGAIVSHFSNDRLLLLTRDFESDLFSVHYTDSDNLPPFLSCLPEFHGAMRSSTVETPNEKEHDVDSGGSVRGREPQQRFPGQYLRPTLGRRDDPASRCRDQGSAGSDCREL